MSRITFTPTLMGFSMDGPSNNVFVRQWKISLAIGFSGFFCKGKYLQIQISSPIDPGSFEKLLQ